MGPFIRLLKDETYIDEVKLLRGVIGPRRAANWHNGRTDKSIYREHFAPKN